MQPGAPVEQVAERGHRLDRQLVRLERLHHLPEHRGRGAGDGDQHLARIGLLHDAGQIGRGSEHRDPVDPPPHLGGIVVHERHRAVAVVAPGQDLPRQDLARVARPVDQHALGAVVREVLASEPPAHPRRRHEHDHQHQVHHEHAARIGAQLEHAADHQAEDHAARGRAGRDGPQIAEPDVLPERVVDVEAHEGDHADEDQERDGLQPQRPVLGRDRPVEAEPERQVARGRRHQCVREDHRGPAGGDRSYQRTPRSRSRPCPAPRAAARAREARSDHLDAPLVGSWW